MLLSVLKHLHGWREKLRKRRKRGIHPGKRIQTILTDYLGFRYGAMER